MPDAVPWSILTVLFGLCSADTNNGQVIVGELYTAQFKGAALFSRNATQDPMPASVVDFCQRQSFLQDDLLLQKLKESTAVGLGSAAVDVRAYINPNSNTPTTQSDSESLEVVIIIAIVIACVAFMFLVFAIYWAWRYDKKNRDAYLTNKGTEDDRTYDGGDSPEGKDARAAAQKRTEDPTSVVVPSYPSVIGGDSAADGVYPESVISEDINSSLTQYYQSGLQITMAIVEDCKMPEV